MSKDPAFLFYPGDWLGGTLGMTFEQKGAYMELLMLQFNRGHMTKDMIGQTVGQLWDIIQDKFIQDEKGLYYNVRLEDEKEKRKRYTESRRNNKKGTNQHSNQQQKKEGHMTSHMEDENENENEDISKVEIKNDNNIDFAEVLETHPFEDFWNTYAKKKGDKAKCEKKYKKLTDPEKEEIYHTLPGYVKSTPDKQYRLNPETYLNQKGWTDEIITPNGRDNKTQGSITTDEISEYVDANS